MKPFPRGLAPSFRKRVFDEVVRGQGYAKELENNLAVLGNNPGPEGELVRRDLSEKVCGSFYNIHAMLSHEELEKGSKVVAVARQTMKKGKTNASEDEEGSVRSSPATPKGRRGCYKRRNNRETWTELTPGMTADDHHWRKYGQKSILNAAHPRSYFRCTHKFDQNCMATKQVQKISDDPIEFSSVYQGQHTCTDAHRLKMTEIISDNYVSNNIGNGGSPVMISFERNNTIGAPSKNEVAAVPSASSNENCFDTFGPVGNISFISSDPEDVVSCGHRESSSYMDMMMDWGDTDDFELDYGSAGDIIDG